MKKISSILCSILTAFCLCVPTTMVNANDSTQNIETLATNFVSGDERFITSINSSSFIIFNVHVGANVTRENNFLIKEYNAVYANVTQEDSQNISASGIVKNSITADIKGTYLNITVSFRYDILNSSGMYVFRDRTATYTVRAD